MPTGFFRFPAWDVGSRPYGRRWGCLGSCFAFLPFGRNPRRTDAGRTGSLPSPPWEVLEPSLRLPAVCSTAMCSYHYHRRRDPERTDRGGLSRYYTLLDYSQLE